MTPRLRWALAFVVVLFVAGGVAGWFIFAPASIDVGPASRPSAPATGPEKEARKIKARLFFVADDGLHLRAVEQDVAYAADSAEQARAILTEELAPVAPPLVSAIPAGTALRAVYVTPQGQAYVDLSAEVATHHAGGSLNEMLTIYSIVHALTSNLPAITAVQILVDGKEVDTLAGHIDLRQPLSARASLSSEPAK